MINEQYEILEKEKKYNNYLKYQNDLRQEKRSNNPNILSNEQLSSPLSVNRSLLNTYGSITSQELRQNENMIDNKIKSLQNKMNKEFKDIAVSNNISDNNVNTLNEDIFNSPSSKNKLNDRYKTTEEILNSSLSQKNSEKIEKSFTLKNEIHNLQIANNNKKPLYDSKFIDDDMNSKSFKSQQNSRYSSKPNVLTSPFSTKNDKDINNYQQNISYYRNLIEHMQNEIGVLNNKIITLEQSNNDPQIIPKKFQIDQKINDLKYELEMKLKLRDEEVKENNMKLAQIQFDNNVLLGKNTRLEEDIKKLENVVEGFTKTKETKINNPLMKPVTRERGLKRAKSEFKLKKEESIKTNKRIISARPNSSNKEKEKNEKLKQENENLKKRLKNVQTFLKKHRNKLSLDQIELRGKENMKMEIAIWKNREESLVTRYLHIINSFKQQVIHEKEQFSDILQQLSSYCNDNVKSIQIKYEEQISLYEDKYNNLKKENDELKSKLSKLKNIVSINKQR